MLFKPKDIEILKVKGWKEIQYAITDQKKNGKIISEKNRHFSGGPMAKNPPSNADDTGSIPGWGTKDPIWHTHATTMQPKYFLKKEKKADFKPNSFMSNVTI